MIFTSLVATGYYCDIVIVIVILWYFYIYLYSGGRVRGIADRSVSKTQGWIFWVKFIFVFFILFVQPGDGDGDGDGRD